jgi:murein DD-endopeptidase MepM/ murein hydrolase activator NlpD
VSVNENGNFGMFGRLKRILRFPLVFVILFSLLINILQYDILPNISLSSAAVVDFSDETLRCMQIEVSKEELTEQAEEAGLETGEYMAALFLSSGLKITRENLSVSSRKIRKMRNKYMRFSPENFRNLSYVLNGLIEDLTYFPIPVSTEGFEWVQYCDSWGGERTYGGTRQHEGTDILALNNTAGIYPVLSATSGTVTNIGWLELGGWRIGITSENGIYYYYAHLDSYADLKKGDKVNAGDLLGFMGNTGYSKVEGTKGKFDVHLHFGIYLTDENGDEIAINPYFLLKTIEQNVMYYKYGG